MASVAAGPAARVRALTSLITSPVNTPASPTYSFASTANPLSSYGLPFPPPPRPDHQVLTKADLDQSQRAYADLISSAKAYRLALASLATAASAFGTALEACARLKEARAESLQPALLLPRANAPPVDAGPPPPLLASPPSEPLPASIAASFVGPRPSCTADTLMAASGVQHLIANHQQILSETVYRGFELPLLHEVDRWRRDVDDEAEAYKTAVQAQTREIRRLERDGLRLHRQRRRDLARFRAHLVDLTAKLDGLAALHTDHARTLLRDGQEASARILDASCSLVRAEVDIFESLARKGWSGGGLEDLLELGVDLFATEDDAAATGAAKSASGADPVGAGLSAASDAGRGGSVDAAGALFSILPPKSILADAGSDGSITTLTHAHSHTRSDSLLVDCDRYQSLTAVATGHSPRPETDFNRPRNARPFSPQPIRRVPIDATIQDNLVAAACIASSPSRSSSRADGDLGGGRRSRGDPTDEDEGKRHEERDELDPALQRPPPPAHVGGHPLEDQPWRDLRGWPDAEADSSGSDAGSVAGADLDQERGRRSEAG